MACTLSACSVLHTPLDEGCLMACTSSACSVLCHRVCFCALQTPLDEDDCCLVLASDGVWDHWAFDDAIARLLTEGAGTAGAQVTSEAIVNGFFENTRIKGEEAFGEGADNLTGVVGVFPIPPA